MEYEQAKSCMNDTNLPLNMAQQDAMFTLCRAAMWKSLGIQCQLSKTGFNIVFSAPYRLHDPELSHCLSIALKQIEYAGIDITSVSMPDFIAYQAWKNEIDTEKKISGSRILITKKCGVHDKKPMLNVLLIDGMGEVIETVHVACMTCRVESENKMGGIGAYINLPDYNAIYRIIDDFRCKYPSYANAVVIDNNK